MTLLTETITDHRDASDFDEGFRPAFMAVNPGMLFGTVM
jgi:hypothetical protein